MSSYKLPSSRQWAHPSVPFKTVCRCGKYAVLSLLVLRVNNHTHTLHTGQKVTAHPRASHAHSRCLQRTIVLRPQCHTRRTTPCSHWLLLTGFWTAVVLFLARVFITGVPPVALRVTNGIQHEITEHSTQFKAMAQRVQGFEFPFPQIGDSAKPSLCATRQRQPCATTVERRHNFIRSQLARRQVCKTMHRRKRANVSWSLPLSPCR